MPLKNRSVDEIIRIISAGGGVRFDAGGWATRDLVQIATASKGRPTRVVLRGLTGRRADELIQIATAAGGNVTFED